MSNTVYNYKSIKKAVRTGAPLKWIKEHLASGTPDYIIKDLMEQARQEIFEEDVVMKKRLGQLLYG